MPLYGVPFLLGTNLEFGAPVRRDGVTFRYGDVTDTRLPTESHRCDHLHVWLIEHGDAI